MTAEQLASVTETYYYYAPSSTTMTAQEGTHGDAAVQVDFTGIPIQVTYVVINLSGTQSIRSTVTQMGGDLPQLPKQVKSVQVPYESFHYYAPSQMKHGDDVDYDPTTDTQFTKAAAGSYVLVDAPVETTEVPYDDSPIYVTYDWAGDHDWDLTGKGRYNIRLKYNNDYYYLAPNEHNNYQGYTVDGAKMDSEADSRLVTQQYL